MGDLLKYVIAIVVIYFVVQSFPSPHSSIGSSHSQPVYIKSTSTDKETLKEIPNPYYISKPWPDHSAYGLELAVGKGFVKPYNLGEFDCSEMASFLQWKLKNYGFNAKICVSHNFRGKGGHAWVAVDIPRKNVSSLRYYVEPISSNVGDFNFMIIKPYSGYVRDYGNYDAIYNSIYDLAKKEPIYEYDWWTELNYTEIVNMR